MRISIGWSFERYSTTTVHRYCGSQLSGYFSNIPPSAIGLRNNKCRKIIKINWDEKQLQ